MKYLCVFAYICIYNMKARNSKKRYGTRGVIKTANIKIHYVCVYLCVYIYILYAYIHLKTVSIFIHSKVIYI